MEGHFVLLCVGFVVNVSGFVDRLKESGFSSHFLRHRVSRPITRAIDRQAKHIPLWYTVRGHFQGALREGPTLVGLVPNQCSPVFTNLWAAGIPRMGYYKCLTVIET
jgi:hypothetical protein